MKTKDKIINESIKLFAENGFEGTSMASIAKQIGVTKPSLYAHYENKLALFEGCLEKISNEQIEFTVKILSNPNLNTAEKKLFALLKDCSLMVSEKKYSFYNRFYFLPPLELKELIENKFEKATTICDDLITNIIREAVNNGEMDEQLSVEEITNSYKCLMDGVSCRLDTYNNFDSIWKVFWRGVKP
ncbi:TetR/AcrR family transcriptional regulator [Lysinibacillus capsici]|uniref:TetR/AcrR family transcriptional regulator n=1 Tax=Lysinibacillus capsici TaxID=2115968 RepID=UPI002DBCF455|nr:TetR/AcrR family transcriptional regulator [Lysinibacillus capsici]MEC1306036.1 TetR/AcrR family transcriptional regulator [Lysinibacillus capsici]